MDIRRFDIAFDFFIEKMGEDVARELQDGQDVTDVFADDIARPVKAVIIQAEGPGAGIPTWSSPSRMRITPGNGHPRTWTWNPMTTRSGRSPDGEEFLSPCNGL